jgi:two-component system chemotaxis response regulator CheY
MFPRETNFLVVDDMEPLRRVVRSMLRELGYDRVFEAPAASQAVQILEKGASVGHEIEIILCDWQMPGMTGLEFLEFVRTTEQYARLPFVMITAEGQRDQIISAIQAGVSSYLVKPISLGQLEDKLKAVWLKMKATGMAPGVPPAGTVFAPPPPPPAAPASAQSGATPAAAVPPAARPPAAT